MSRLSETSSGCLVL